MEIKDYIQKAEYDPQGQLIWCNTIERGLTRLLDVRGWGTIQQLFRSNKGIDFDAAAKFQDQVGEFITQAINEKLAREAVISPEQQWEDYKHNCICARATLFPDLSEPALRRMLDLQKADFIKSRTTNREANEQSEVHEPRTTN